MFGFVAEKILHVEFAKCDNGVSDVDTVGEPRRSDDEGGGSHKIPAPYCMCQKKKQKARCAFFWYIQHSSKIMRFQLQITASNVEKSLSRFQIEPFQQHGVDSWGTDVETVFGQDGMHRVRARPIVLMGNGGAIK